MSKIYHQCGHNAIWNIDAFREGVGDGIIVSPVNQKIKDVEGLRSDVKSKSMFDPQFYLPSSQKKNFIDYPFFPETISGEGGFSTIEFSQVADESARLCLQFQVENKFEKIIIPARYFSQMITDWLPQQELFLRPFLSLIERSNLKTEVFQTLPLTQFMILDKGFREQILNWITSFPRVDGVYLLVSIVEDSKQIKDGTLIYEMMNFIRSCALANLKLIVGYTNAESLPLSLASDCDFTIGTFENTRRFSDGRFVESEEDKRGPKARIYMPALFTWIQFNHAKEIRDADKNLWKLIHHDSKYADEAFGYIKEPTFNQPALYRHYFQVFSEQFSLYSKLDVKTRYVKLRDGFKLAQDLYGKIEALPVDLDRHAKGEHIPVWLDAINKFYREFMK